MKSSLRKLSFGTSLAVLIICLVLVTGSTFSLFTSKVDTNIGVTSATVALTAEISGDSLTLLSKGVEQETNFENGGTATFNDSATVLTLTNITPGDKAVFDIVVTNKSNVNIQYRVNWFIDGELAEGLVATVDGATLATGTSEWASWTPDQDKVKKISVSVELPIDAGNEYQNKTAEISFSVEAVQANGTYDYTAYVSSAAGLQAAFNSGAKEIVLNNDIELTETVEIPAGATVALNLNGKTLAGTVGRDTENNRVHVIVNNGNLAIGNGTVSSEGVNGGSAIYNAEGATLTVENAILNGAPQSGDETWPSYTVNNYGALTVTDSTITGCQGVISTGEKASTTVENVIATRDGWGSSGHVFYTSSTGKLTVNGGTYTNHGNVDGTMFTGGETVVNDGTFIVDQGAYFSLSSSLKLTVNGGDFSNIKSVLAWGGTMTVSGGAFGFDPTAYVAEGLKVVNADGVYYVVSENITLAYNAASLSDALVAGGEITVVNDIALSDTSVTVPSGVTATLNLNGNTISGTFVNTGNSNKTLIDVKGNLTVNGTGIITMNTTGVNMGWNAMGCTVCVNGGDLTVNNATIMNEGGTDMSFALDTNPWNPSSNEVLDVVLNNATIESTQYRGIRVRDNGPYLVKLVANDSTIDEIWYQEYSDGTNNNSGNYGVKVEVNLNNTTADVSRVKENGVLFIDGAIVVVTTEGLASAIENGADEVVLGAGNYTMPTTTGDITIVGNEGTIISGNDCTADKLTMTGVTIQSTGNAYTGIKHSDEVVYNNCTIVGNMYLYANKVVFNDCTFDLSTTNDYVWVYGATNVEFNNCTFNTMGKAILVFQDGSKVSQTVKVEGCTFNASAPAYNWDKTIHIAAVSIDGSQGGTYNVILNNNIVDSNFNGLWQDKTDAGNITVTVDGETVLEPNN